MKIGHKLLFSLLTINALVAVLLVGAWYNGTIGKDGMNTLRRQSMNALTVEQAGKSLALARIQITANLSSDTPDWSGADRLLARSLELQLQASGSIVNSERRAKSEEIARLMAVYQSEVGKIRTLPAEERLPVIQKARSLGEQINRQSDELTEMVNKSLNKNSDSLIEQIEEVNQLSLGVGMLVLLVTLAMAYALTRMIAHPVRRMTDTMTKLAEGHTDLDIWGQQRRDEIGDMARTVEIFRKNAIENLQMHREQDELRQQADQSRRQSMKSMADNVEHEAVSSSQDIFGLTQEMAKSAEHLFSVAKHTSEGATTASAAAAEALSSAQTVASAADELHASISEISRQISCTKSIAHDALTSSSRAQGVMDGLTDATRQIESMVEMISQIASQTNLLALNATIEAARAGDAGKGFAVVANEVKVLANQTARATEDITNLIQNIGSVAQQATTSIRDIAQTIDRLEEGTTAVAVAVEEQSAATSEIARAVSQTAEASHQVSSLMETLASEAVRSCDLSDEVKKDGARISETLKGFSRTLGRVIRTSSTDVCRRSEPRYGVFFTAHADFGQGPKDVFISNLSCRGLTLLAEKHGLGQGPVPVRVQADVLGQTVTGSVVAVEGNFLHISLSVDSHLTSQKVLSLAVQGAKALLAKAKSDHQGFVASVLNVLNGTTRTKSADLANHHTCRLGKWYDNVAEAHIRSLPSYVNLVGPHKRVHDAGKACLHAFWHHDRDEAERQAQALRDASAEVIALLDRLSTEMDHSAVSQSA